MKSLRGETLGVVGGIGPLASAEFVRTVYRCASWDREQEAPRVLMDSNPAFPDRTSAFLAGEDDAVLPMLVEVLDGLVRLGATRLRQLGMGLVAGAVLVWALQGGTDNGWPTAAELLTLGAYTTLMSVVFLMACVVPTWRALAVQPTEVLKE